MRQVTGAAGEGGVVPKLAAKDDDNDVEAPLDEEDDGGLFVLPWETLQDGKTIGVYRE